MGFLGERIIFVVCPIGNDGRWISAGIGLLFFRFWRLGPFFAGRGRCRRLTAIYMLATLMSVVQMRTRRRLLSKKITFPETSSNIKKESNFFRTIRLSSEETRFVFTPFPFALLLRLEAFYLIPNSYLINRKSLIQKIQTLNK